MRTQWSVLLAALLLAGAAWCAEDVITLTDGRTVSGKIVKEDADAIYLQVATGEQRGVAKSRIAKVERAAGGVQKNPAKPAVELPEGPKPAHTESAGVALLEIRDLGSPDPAVRKAAFEKIAKNKADRMDLLLGLLHPKKDTDEATRLGIVRAIAELPPLTEQASRVLAYNAVFDPFPEVRREVCCAIRTLADDTAIRELLKFAATENAAMRHALAAAMREIDDPRMLAALVRSIPMPSINANVEGPTTVGEPKYNLPIGPGGMKMPIWLPTQSVTGTATDIDSPAAQLLKEIARKDLGTHPLAWYNWYREKTGDLTTVEAQTYREKRSARERMNVPETNQ